MAAPASTSQPASREGLSRLAVNYRAVRGASERLSALLTAEDHMVQSASEASPTKWHLAHTTWFLETFVLAPHVDGYRHFDRRFTYLFNSYYKQVEGHPLRSIRGTFSRPSLQEVRAYRRHVDAAMEALLENLGAPIATLVELGLNHEQQHQELIVTDIKHAFWTNPVRPSLTSGKEASAATAPAEWREFAGGTFEIGYSGEDFAFDNETPRHQVLLRPYRLCSRLTCNSEYIEFIEAGGYSRPELWLSEGWDHINTNKWHAPFYWEKQDGEWWVFTSSGMQLLDPAEPVCHISYYEADAYARWRGCRLPTEAEWEIAAGAEPIRGNFAETGLFHPMPANGRGLQQMFGDVWEWTASPYVAYPGYCAPGGALGEYNGKFMCNQIVLRGGSCATPQSHIRGTYRNFFPAHTRWQFMGVRLADDCA